MEWKAYLAAFVLIFSDARGQISSTCPEPSESNPCRCQERSHGLSFTCANIADESELELSFVGNYEGQKLYEVYIINSSLKKISRNVFGYGFEYIVISNSSIESISNDAFEDSKSSLALISFDSVPISENGFSFEQFAEYTNLGQMRVINTSITRIPTIISNTLYELYIANNSVQVVYTGAFATLPSLNYLLLMWGNTSQLESDAFVGPQELEILNLAGNNLSLLSSSSFTNLQVLFKLDVSYNRLSESSFEEGFFSHFPKLSTLYMQKNQFQNIPKEALKQLPNLFDFDLSANGLTTIDPDTFIANPLLARLYLDDNNFEAVEDGWFNGMTLQYSTISLKSCNVASISPLAFGNFSNAVIHLEDNQLSTVEESWSRPLLERRCVIDVTGNPLTCGCDFAWILEDQLFKEYLIGYCQDGTSIDSLDSSYFDGCSL